jgi:glycoside/pentoside/hexuronide:cation symporter, GPH family
MNNTSKVSLLEKIGYSQAEIGINVVYRSLMVFLPIFYTDVFGLSAAAVGTLLLVCRNSDGLADVLMGMMADRTNTRWGKFRPWLLWMALPFGIMTVVLFTTPDLGSSGKMIYAYVTYSIFLLVFTAYTIPNSSLTGVITSDPTERTSVSSYRFMFAFFGGLITQGFTVYLVSKLGHGDKMAGYKNTMILFASMAVITFIISFLSVRERVLPPKAQQHNFKKDFKNLISNKPWVILFFVGILYCTFTTLRQGTTMYYFKYFLNNESLAAWFMGTGLAASILGAFLTSWLVNLMGRKKLFILSAVVAALGCIFNYFARPTDVSLIFSINWIVEFLSAPMITLFMAGLGDAADFGEWKTGRRATGLSYSAGTFAIKFGSGIAGAGVGWILYFYGYVANQQQTMESLKGIKMLMSFYPAIILTFLILLLTFYNLDEKMLETVEKDLADRRVKELDPAT